MWSFTSPEIVFGEDALNRLEELQGERAVIVTDATILQLGFPKRVQEVLNTAGIASEVFAEVEEEPSLQTIRRGARYLDEYQPDWIIGLGGGSCMDAAKAMWVLYERPDLPPEAISPLEILGLRGKARLVTIPTTAGTGSEVGYASVLTDLEENRKLTLGSRETTPDIAIVDPQFTADLPRQLTADTGADVLTHAVEGYTSTWANDFTDGPCLKAIHLVFRYLPRAVERGAEDPRAREKMANAAAIAGLALGNSQVALAHAMGHAAGTCLPLPHGRITALFLPYTIEFNAAAGVGRYRDIAYILGLSAEDEAQAAATVARAVRELLVSIGQPRSLLEAGVAEADFEAHLGEICEHTEIDTSILMARRIPERAEIEQLFRYAFRGRRVDF